MPERPWVGSRYGENCLCGRLQAAFHVCLDRDRIVSEFDSMLCPEPPHLARLTIGYVPEYRRFLERDSGNNDAWLATSAAPALML